MDASYDVVFAVWQHCPAEIDLPRTGRVLRMKDRGASESERERGKSYIYVAFTVGQQTGILQFRPNRGSSLPQPFLLSCCCLLRRRIATLWLTDGRTDAIARNSEAGGDRGKERKGARGMKQVLNGVGLPHFFSRINLKLDEKTNPKTSRLATPVHSDDLKF